MFSLINDENYQYMLETLYVTFVVSLVKNAPEGFTSNNWVNPHPIDVDPWKRDNRFLYDQV